MIWIYKNKVLIEFNLYGFEDFCLFNSWSLYAYLVFLKNLKHMNSYLLCSLCLNFRNLSENFLETIFCLSDSSYDGAILPLMTIISSESEV